MTLARRYLQTRVGSASPMESSVMATVARSRPSRETSAAPGIIAATDPANNGMSSQ